MNWISVQEKLPETNAPVLCYVRSTATGNTAFTVGSCEKNEYWFLQSGVGTNSFPHHYWEVTHWQPLPEAPEAGE